MLFQCYKVYQYSLCKETNYDVVEEFGVILDGWTGRHRSSRIPSEVQRDNMKENESSFQIELVLNSLKGENGAIMFRQPKESNP